MSADETPKESFRLTFHTEQVAERVWVARVEGPTGATGEGATEVEAIGYAREAAFKAMFGFGVGK